MRSDLLSFLDITRITLAVINLSFLHCLRPSLATIAGKHGSLSRGNASFTGIINSCTRAHMSDGPKCQLSSANLEAEQTWEGIPLEASQRWRCRQNSVCFTVSRHKQTQPPLSADLSGLALLMGFKKLLPRANTPQQGTCTATFTHTLTHTPLCRGWWWWWWRDPDVKQTSAGWQ